MKNFFKRKGFLHKYLEKQFSLYQQEKFGFIAAFLAQQRISYLQNSLVTNEKIWQDLQEQEIEEHWALAQADHLNQLFLQLDSLHRLTRNKPLIVNPKEELFLQMTSLIDPNSFPIFSLSNNYKKEISLWDYDKEIIKQLEKEIGFSIYVKESSVEHHGAGDGLFVSCENMIPPGTLLALIPGTTFAPEEENEKKGLVIRFDKTKFDVDSDLPFPFPLGKPLIDLAGINKKFLDSRFVNPFALGHKINHPPPEISANAISLDIAIPFNFFLEDYLKFLPYTEFSSQNRKRSKNIWHNCFRGIGIFSLETLSDGEEIFIDYFENNLVNWEEIDNLEDWQIAPPPISPFFTKENYEYEFKGIAKLLEWYSKYQNRENYYMKMSKKVRPDDSIFKNKEEFILNKIKKNSKNNYFGNYFFHSQVY